MSSSSSPPWDASVHLLTAAPTVEQRRLIIDFRNELKRKIHDAYVLFEEHLTDSMLQRFLIARQYNIAKSLKMMEQALHWRRERDPDRFFRPSLQPADVARFEHEIQTGKTYIAGYDKYGRVVVIFNNTVQNTNCHEDQMDFLSWVLELAIKISPSNRDKYVIFMHLDNFSFFNCPPMKTTIETCKMLVTCLPERLGHCICYHPPGVFHSIFHTLKPFIDKRTTSKMVFVYGSIEAGGDNDVLMNSVIGSEWKTLTGVEQKPVAKGFSPGYIHQDVWPRHLKYVESVCGEPEQTEQQSEQSEQSEQSDQTAQINKSKLFISTSFSSPTPASQSSFSSSASPQTQFSSYASMGSAGYNATPATRATTSSTNQSPSPGTSPASSLHTPLSQQLLLQQQAKEELARLFDRERNKRVTKLGLAALLGSSGVTGILLWQGASTIEALVLGMAAMITSLVLLTTEV